MPRTHIVDPSAAADVRPSIVLHRRDEKRNSWRYEAPAPAEGEPLPLMRSAYVAKDTLATLGDPDSIRITIAAE